MINKDEVETPVKLPKKGKQYIRKHQNEFDIHAIVKIKRGKRLLLLTFVKWVLKTQCRIFKFFYVGNQNWMEVVIKLFIFTYYKVIYFRTSKHNYCFQS